MRVRVAVLAAAFVALFALPASANGFANWAAIVVAGDHQAHDGSDSEVFDNGRRDIGAALQRIGFSANNIEEFSTEPSLYRAQQPQLSDPGVISGALWDLSNRTSGGCLVYFTSHGSQDGVVVGNDTLAPKNLARIVKNACGDRLSVVIVSACFSGVFVPALRDPSHFVLTAARPDRTSFGCGQADRYTFFDECFLQSIGGAHDFPDLGKSVRACVAAREIWEKAKPPSDPQIFIGANTAALPQW